MVGPFVCRVTTYVKGAGNAEEEHPETTAEETRLLQAERTGGPGSEAYRYVQQLAARRTSPAKGRVKVNGGPLWLSNLAYTSTDSWWTARG